MLTVFIEARRSTHSHSSASDAEALSVHESIIFDSLIAAIFNTRGMCLSGFAQKDSWDMF